MIHNFLRPEPCDRGSNCPPVSQTFLPRHAGLSDIGRVRTANEDCWYADPRQRLYLVADGMGGHLAGELASRLIVDVLPQQINEAVDSTTDLADATTVDRVVDAVAALSRGVRKESCDEPGLAGMGATLVLAMVRGAQAVTVHLGDSRAYLWRTGRIRRLVAPFVWG